VKFGRSEEHSATGLEVNFEGLEGYREFAAEWTSGWGEHRFEPRELIDLGDRFLVLTELIARGQAAASR
jgi:hypothetical protein